MTESNSIGALVDQVLNPPTMGMGGGSKTEEQAQDRHKAACAEAIRQRTLKATSAEMAVLDALCTVLGMNQAAKEDAVPEANTAGKPGRTIPNPIPEGYHGSITIDDLAKNAKTLADASNVFGDKKQNVADLLLDLIAIDAKRTTPIDIVASAFKSVCEGVAASAPVTLESIAEPLRPEMTVRDLVELPDALIRELCALRGIRLADEPLRISGAPDASCSNTTSATHPLIAAIDKAKVVPVSDEENARLSLVAKSNQWVPDAEFRQAVGLASSPPIDEPRIDPNQAAAVKRLEDAMCAGSLLIPGIGIAKIVDYNSRAIETFPPRRTTILTLELNHNA